MMRKRSFVVFFFFCVLLLFSCSHESSYSGESVPYPERIWTTIIYMGADNDLTAVALDDIAEMQAAAACLENSGHTVIALFDGVAEGDSCLYVMDGGSPCSLADCPELGLLTDGSSELNMASCETLKHLLSFARRAYPASHYALIIWGHGCGWRGYTIDENSDAVMSLPALHEAVTCAESPLSVIAFDCCYGAMLETVYEFRNDAEILVATERDEPAAGWNYTLFFQALAESASGARTEAVLTSPAERYARAAVSAFGSQYAAADGTSITAFSLSKAEAVFEAFEAFSRSCAGCITTRAASVYFTTQILPQAVSFLTGEYPAYRFTDIAELASCFPETGIPSCSTALMETTSIAAERLIAELNDAVIVSFEGGSGVESGLSEKPMLGVYLATMREGGVIEPDYSQLYIRGSGVAGQSAFVRVSTGWVPQQLVSQSSSLLDRLFRMPLP